MLLIRYKNKRSCKELMNDLNMKKPPIIDKSKSGWILKLELLLHLIQPYPGVRYEFVIKVIGKEITYNINMMLYFICSLRIYTLIKVIRYYNLFAQEHPKSILKFYDKNSSSQTFLYRANLKQNGFVTIAIIGSMTLLYSSVIFQVVEYDKKDENNPYYYLWNCSWYIIVTMCTSIIKIKLSWIRRYDPTFNFRKNSSHRGLLSWNLHNISICSNFVIICQSR